MTVGIWKYDIIKLKAWWLSEALDKWFQIQSIPSVNELKKNERKKIYELMNALRLVNNA